MIETCEGTAWCPTCHRDDEMEPYGNGLRCPECRTYVPGPLWRARAVVAAQRERYKQEEAVRRHAESRLGLLRQKLNYLGISGGEVEDGRIVHGDLAFSLDYRNELKVAVCCPDCATHKFVRGVYRLADVGLAIQAGQAAECKVCHPEAVPPTAPTVSQRLTAAIGDLVREILEEERQ